MLTSVTSFIGTVTGKIVLGATVAAASFGGLTATGAISGPGGREDRPAVVTSESDAEIEAPEATLPTDDPAADPLDDAVPDEATAPDDEADDDTSDDEADDDTSDDEADDDSSDHEGDDDSSHGGSSGKDSGGSSSGDHGQSDSDD